MKMIVSIAGFRVLTLVNINMCRTIIVTAAEKKLKNFTYMMMDDNYVPTVCYRYLKDYNILPTSSTDIRELILCYYWYQRAILPIR